MTKEELFEPITKKYNELKLALQGTDIDKIRELTLEVHAMVHPAEISGRTEKTIADYVLDYMLRGNQNELVPREDYDVVYITQALEPFLCVGNFGIHIELKI